MHIKRIIGIVLFLFLITPKLPCAASTPPGDVNGDAVVNFADILSSSTRYGQTSVSSTQDQIVDGKFNAMDTAMTIQRILMPTLTPTSTPTRTPTPTMRPTSAPTSTPIPTPTPTVSTAYTNLSATLYGEFAFFKFTPLTTSSMYYIDIAPSSNMVTGMYFNFGQGNSPVTVRDPKKWSAYTCGTTLYWRVRSEQTVLSPIQQTLVNCTAPTPTSAPISFNPVKVMVIDFNPIIESAGGKRIREVKGWANPLTLEAQYINDTQTMSNNTYRYSIVARVDNIDAFPVLTDGFQYTDEGYLLMLFNQSTHHFPEGADYLKILRDYQVCEKVNAGQVDELWLWGGPWFGYAESVMTGPGAFRTNDSPLSGSTCNRKLNIMGFSYERGISEMLEDLGHRMEGTMSFLYKENPTVTATTATIWGKYVKDCGWMHFAPNSTSSYDWGNPSSVTSACNDWLTYPTLIGKTDTFTCSLWSCDGYLYKKWWFNHLPKAAGRSGTYWNNWWNYLIDFDKANAFP